MFCLDLHNFLALPGQYLAQPSHRVLHLPHFQREIAHIILELHQHLRVNLVIASHSSSLVIHRITRRVQGKLCLTHYASLIIIYILYPLYVVRSRGPDHLYSLSNL